MPISASRNYFIAQISAKDTDTGDNGKISYKLAADNGNDFGLFRLEENSGELYLIGKPPQGEKILYHLNVLASDHGNPTLSSKAILTVEFTNSAPFNPFRPQPTGDYKIGPREQEQSSDLSELSGPLNWLDIANDIAIACLGVIFVVLLILLGILLFWMKVNANRQRARQIPKRDNSQRSKNISQTPSFGVESMPINQGRFPQI